MFQVSWLTNPRLIDWSNPVHQNASTRRTAKPILTRANLSAWIAACPSSSRSMSRLARRCRARRKEGRVEVEACLVGECKAGDHYTMIGMYIFENIDERGGCMVL